MKTINIVILEDDPIDRIKIKIMVSEFISTHYKFNLVGVFENLNSIIDFLSTNTTVIDIIISDIFTGKQATGIDLLKKMKHCDIPIILTTQSHDTEIYNDAKQYNCIQYLVKPFHKLTLQSIIESVFVESNREKVRIDLNRKYLFLKGSTDVMNKVFFDDILFLESDGNYCFIHTEGKKYVQKKSMTKLLGELDVDFVRIHSGYAINSKHVKKLQSVSLAITKGIELPIGKRFKKNTFDRLLELKREIIV